MTQLNQVKHQMTISLLNHLYDANMADTTDGEVNDLYSANAGQDNLYGHLSDALDSLGWIAQEAREIWIDTGSRSEAIIYVNEQYKLLRSNNA